MAVDDRIEPRRETGARVFFALMPPTDVAKRIVDRACALDLPGRYVSEERLHLTLAFLGRVDIDAIDILLARGDGIRVAAFDLALDRAGGFRRAGINWLAPSVPPDALLDLSRKLYKNTRSNIDKFTYRPHITISRKANALETRAITPIHWPVAAFSLIASGVDGAPGAYRELRRWPLLPGSVTPSGL